MEKYNEREIRYHSCLKEIKTAVKYNPKVSVSKILKEFGMMTVYLAALQSSGILINNGGLRRSAIWEWKSIDPNISMVRELVDDANRLERENTQRVRDRKKEQKEKVNKMDNFKNKANTSGFIQNPENINTLGRPAKEKKNPFIKTETTYLFGIKIITKITTT